MSENGHDLLVAALGQIEMHPETWNQAEWRCSTGFCLAGWMGELSTEVQWQYPEVATSGMVSVGGHEIHVGSWAAGKLGLSLEDDDALFASNNSIEDLRVGVKAVLNGESAARAIQKRRTENTSGL